jgi:glycosyltransferase 2 family protein
MSRWRGTAGAGGEDHALRRRKSALQRCVMPIVGTAVLSLAGFLLYRALSGYQLEEIAASIAAIRGEHLALALGFAAASYLCLTGFDMLGVRYIGRALPYRSVALASFVSLSIGHNIGFSALGTGAIRYRFYSRWGLRAGEVARVILFSGTTDGLGLITLGGLALLLQPRLAEEVTNLDREVIRGLGAGCLALAICYLGLAAGLRRPLRLGRWPLHMPNLTLAIGQVIIGPLNFACVAACLHQALAATAETSYLSVVAVYVIATLGSLITHAPGGLGVIESVALFLLPQREIIGALIVFRVIYFLLPLAIGSRLSSTKPTPAARAISA